MTEEEDGICKTVVFVALTAAATGAGASALAKDAFKADLDGYQETPAVSTTRLGEIRGLIR